MNNNELIQQARELCEKRLTGTNKYHGSIATKSSRCGDGVYDSIIERLYHFEYDIVPQLCDALEAMTARAEAAEAERDAAIADLKRFSACCQCSANIDGSCCDMFDGTAENKYFCSNWQWRGPQAEKGEAK